MLRSLQIGPDDDISRDPVWREAVLVTPRHAVRRRWNAAALRRHCARTGHQLYRCPADDRIAGRPLSLVEQYSLHASKSGADERRRLADDVELAVGMKVMVTFNIQTELDIANGARGTIVDIVLHPDEPHLDASAPEVTLRYPPAYVLVKLERTSMQQSFSLTTATGRHTVERSQLPITGAYAFTDYRSQGQTICPVIVDIATPPGGLLSGFSVYVACSRGRGRDHIRLLRGFDYKLFMTHPSENLRVEDLRLEGLDAETKRRHDAIVQSDEFAMELD